MKCPQCEAPNLEPKELEPGLIVAGCNGCKGVLIPLMNYRYWVESEKYVSSDERVNDGVTAEDSSTAKICPKCSRMMTKYQIGANVENRVELCSSCDEAWLDRGEWRLLRQLDLSDKLPNIFTEAWQRNIREERKLDSLREHIRDELGEKDYKKVVDIAQWLSGSEKRNDVVRYIQLLSK